MHLLVLQHGRPSLGGSGHSELRECWEPGSVRAERSLLPSQLRALKKKLEEGMVFTEYEQIPNKKANGIYSTAALPENAERSRIREVVPYEENRVELIPTKENNTGYINASHIKVRGAWGVYSGPRAGSESSNGP